MENFIRLTVNVSDDKYNLYSGTMYAKVSEIEAFGKCYKTNSRNIRGFVQVKGITYTVEEDEHDICMAISKAQDKLHQKEELRIKAEERKESENQRIALLSSGKMSDVEVRRERWLDEDIKMDKKGENGFETRIYNSLVRYFCCKDIRKVTWRDVYNLSPSTNVRNLSCRSLEMAQNFIKSKLEDIK